MASSTDRWSGAGDPSPRTGADRWRAVYAADPARSRGRLVEEPPSRTRTDFQRDRDRVIHSAAFRRLKHKTQVFIEHEGDHYRTRLTHTIEVAQIARSIARALGLDEDLAETLALGHDLGHTPFGHAGERALDAVMSSHGGFDHNAQSLRIVTRLERRYAAFDGLNLTWDSLEGLVKHNGPLVGPLAAPSLPTVPGVILDYDRLNPLDLSRFAAAEAQAAAIADDIAYNAHDIDDGARAGLLSLDLLRAVPFLAETLDAIGDQWPGLEPARLLHELIRRLITCAIEDVISESRRRLDLLRPVGVGDVRAASDVVVTFSSGFKKVDASLKAFLKANLYRHRRVMTVMDDAAGIVGDLFGRLFETPGLMPEEWCHGLDTADEDRRARRVADFIAGMTDRYALELHRRLFDVTPQLR